MLQDKAPRPATGLQVDIVDTPDAFDALAPAWRRLQARDMESTVFLTWDWLALAFRQNPWRWSVLVVRDPVDSDEAICIVPLKYRTHWSRSQQEFQTQLEAGGRLLFSEYTGFLCDPSQEEAGLAAAILGQRARGDEVVAAGGRGGGQGADGPQQGGGAAHQRHWRQQSGRLCTR